MVVHPGYVVSGVQREYSTNGPKSSNPRGIHTLENSTAKPPSRTSSSTTTRPAAVLFSVQDSITQIMKQSPPPPPPPPMQRSQGNAYGGYQRPRTTAAGEQRGYSKAYKSMPGHHTPTPVRYGAHMIPPAAVQHRDVMAPPTSGKWSVSSGATGAAPPTHLQHSVGGAGGGGSITTATTDCSPMSASSTSSSSVASEALLADQGIATVSTINSSNTNDKYSGHQDESSTVSSSGDTAAAFAPYVAESLPLVDNNYNMIYPTAELTPTATTAADAPQQYREVQQDMEVADAPVLIQDSSSGAAEAMQSDPRSVYNTKHPSLVTVNDQHTFTFDSLSGLIVRTPSSCAGLYDPASQKEIPWSGNTPTLEGIKQQQQYSMIHPYHQYSHAMIPYGVPSSDATSSTIGSSVDSSTYSQPLGWGNTLTNSHYYNSSLRYISGSCSDNHCPENSGCKDVSGLSSFSAPTEHQQMSHVPLYVSDSDKQDADLFNSSASSVSTNFEGNKDASSYLPMVVDSDNNHSAVAQQPTATMWIPLSYLPGGHSALYQSNTQFAAAPTAPYASSSVPATTPTSAGATVTSYAPAHYFSAGDAVWSTAPPLNTQHTTQHLYNQYQQQQQLQYCCSSQQGSITSSAVYQPSPCHVSYIYGHPTMHQNGVAMCAAPVQLLMAPGPPQVPAGNGEIGG
eukprot:Lankesteria_metandrocarpae@DN3797_c0_g2_i1.p1